MSENLCIECKNGKPCYMYSCSVANDRDKWQAEAEQWKALAGGLYEIAYLYHSISHRHVCIKCSELEILCKAREAGL